MVSLMAVLASRSHSFALYDRNLQSRAPMSRSLCVVRRETFGGSRMSCGALSLRLWGLMMWVLTFWLLDVCVSLTRWWE